MKKTSVVMVLVGLIMVSASYLANAGPGGVLSGIVARTQDFTLLCGPDEYAYTPVRYSCSNEDGSEFGADHPRLPNCGVRQIRIGSEIYQLSGAIKNVLMVRNPMGHVAVATATPHQFRFVILCVDVDPLFE